MRVVVICPKARDYTTEVFDWVREFYRFTGNELEILDPETREGENFVRTYDAVEYPSIYVLGPDGGIVASFRGKPLPQISEVSYYLNS
jgi:hypothetical protein